MGDARAQQGIAREPPTPDAADRVDEPLQTAIVRKTSSASRNSYRKAVQSPPTPTSSIHAKRRRGLQIVLRLGLRRTREAPTVPCSAERVTTYQSARWVGRWVGTRAAPKALAGQG